MMDQVPSATFSDDERDLGDDVLRADELAAQFGDASRDALEALPGRKRHHLFDGPLRRGQAHMAYMRECKKVRRQERVVAEHRAKSSELESAWNAERMRAGDCVGDLPADCARAPHPNQWPAASVLRAGFKQLGDNKTLRSGLDGVSRELGILTAVSSAFWLEQESYLSAEMERVYEERVSPSVCKFYDASPRRMAFGRLQCQLMPHARYPIFENDKWKSVPPQEYLAKCPSRALLNYGTLDVLACAQEMRYLAPDGTYHGQSKTAKDI